ncbi:MAG: hypothetical protein VX151_06670 [Candidatus Thermoplasmatota archaeon]|nr:hypothetical protein [Candidatus Thermoplasmatota archaeon]
MVHDPRAPRLAAATTLMAALAVILTALNLVLDLAGTSGFGPEEAIGIGVMVVMLLIANLASKERTVPALTHAQPHPDAEAFDTVVSAASRTTGNINPTTASILTSILGERQSADQAQVNSAITTLSSGAFGAEVQRTMAAVEAANQTNIEPREAAPADEETGQTLERVLVKPVPLPGRDANSVVDPLTIPGLEPNRVFVTDGVASVPLPGPTHENTAPTPAVVQEASPSLEVAPTLPSMPDLDDLFAEGTENPSDVPAEVPATASPDLPDLDDLFAGPPEPQPASPPAASIELPDLPDLDSLF